MVSAFRILGEGQLALTKFLLLTDKTIDLKNFPVLLSHILERADFRSDLYVFSNLSMDTLDYTGPKVNEGSKGVLLGVGDPIRQLPTRVPSNLPPQVRHAAAYAPGCLVIETESFERTPNIAKELSSHSAFTDWPMVVLVDDAKKTVTNDQAFLWTVFTRFEPAADICAARETVVRNHISYDFPIFIDARMKPSYPAELTPAAETVALVDQNWKKYFPESSKLDPKPEMF
jgi:3-polyprenyl-4-hydroxybenzoate decarboxylase